MLEKVMVDLKRNGIVTNHKLLSYKSIVMDPAYVHIKKESNEDFNIQLEDMVDGNIVLLKII